MNFNTKNKKPVPEEKDPQEEKGKKELSNNKYVMDELKSKYSEKLKENPIVVLGSISSKNEVTDINRIDTDQSGTGGDIGLSFGKGDDYLYVDKNGKINDRLFKDIYKTDENSFHTIVTIMSDLIERSGYSVEQKSKMQRNVIQHLNSLIKKD